MSRDINKDFQSEITKAAFLRDKIQAGGGAGSITFSGLSDTPSGYQSGKFLQSTADGAEWVDIAAGGGGSSAGGSSSNGGLGSNSLYSGISNFSGVLPDALIMDWNNGPPAGGSYYRYELNWMDNDYIYYYDTYSFSSAPTSYLKFNNDFSGTYNEARINGDTTPSASNKPLNISISEFIDSGRAVYYGGGSSSAGGGGGGSSSAFSNNAITSEWSNFYTIVPDALILEDNGGNTGIFTVNQVLSTDQIYYENRYFAGEHKYISFNNTSSGEVGAHNAGISTTVISLSGLIDDDRAMYYGGGSSSAGGGGGAEAQAIDFTGLSGTPSNYEQGKFLVSTSSGITYTGLDGGTVGATHITGLLDTPSDYQSGKFLVSTSSGVAYTGITSEDIEWQWYIDTSSLPSAGENHGMFAHVHSEGAAYMAHAGNWLKIYPNNGGAAGSTSFSGLSDTPSTYNNGKFLQSTDYGVEWVDIPAGAGGGGGGSGGAEIDYFFRNISTNKISNLSGKLPDAIMVDLDYSTTSSMDTMVLPLKTVGGTHSKIYYEAENYAYNGRAVKVFNNSASGTSDGGGIFPQGGNGQNTNHYHFSTAELNKDLQEYIDAGQALYYGGGGSSSSNGDGLTNWTETNGHIIPNSSEDFDLGNAEYKVRHLFLSDNSIWIGDDIKQEGGKKKKRKVDKLPKWFANSLPTTTEQDAIVWYNAKYDPNITTLNQMPLSALVAFAKEKASNTNLTASDLYPAEKNANGSTNDNYDPTDYEYIVDAEETSHVNDLFTNLSDVTTQDKKGKYLKVKDDGTGVEFVDAPSGGSGGSSTNNVVSAIIEADGTITSSSDDWIESVTVGSSAMTLNFVAGYFTQAPSVVVSPKHKDSVSHIAIEYNALSKDSVVVITRGNWNSTNLQLTQYTIIAQHQDRVSGSSSSNGSSSIGGVGNNVSMQSNSNFAGILPDEILVAQANYGTTKFQFRQITSTYIQYMDVYESNYIQFSNDPTGTSPNISNGIGTYTLLDGATTLQNIIDKGHAIYFGGGGGSSTFKDLTDTPSTLTEGSGQYLKVSDDGQTIEYVDLPAGGGSGGSSSINNVTGFRDLTDFSGKLPDAIVTNLRYGLNNATKYPIVLSLVYAQQDGLYYGSDISSFGGDINIKFNTDEQGNTQSSQIVPGSSSSYNIHPDESSTSIADYVSRGDALFYGSSSNGSAEIENNKDLFDGDVPNAISALTSNGAGRKILYLDHYGAGGAHEDEFIYSNHLDNVRFSARFHTNTTDGDWIDQAERITKEGSGSLANYIANGQALYFGGSSLSNGSSAFSASSFQEKILQSNIGSDNSAEFNDLGFTGLEIGAHYRLGGQVRMVAGDLAYGVNMWFYAHQGSFSTNNLVAAMNNRGTADNQTSTFNHIFQATGSALHFSGGGLNSNADRYIQGDGTKINSFLQLEKL